MDPLNVQFSHSKVHTSVLEAILTVNAPGIIHQMHKRTNAIYPVCLQMQYSVQLCNTSPFLSLHHVPLLLLSLHHVPLLPCPLLPYLFPLVLSPFPSLYSSSPSHLQFPEAHSVFNLQAILSLLKIPALFYVLVLKTVVGIPGGVFTAMFTITNMERFELTPTTNGYLLGYLGVISMVSSISLFLSLSEAGPFALLCYLCPFLPSHTPTHTHIHSHTHTHTRPTHSCTHTANARIWCGLFLQALL